MTQCGRGQSGAHARFPTRLAGCWVELVVCLVEFLLLVYLRSTLMCWLLSCLCLFAALLSLSFPSGELCGVFFKS